MNIQEKENLVHDYLDGIISQQELETLQALLKNDAEARGVYREAIFLHSALQQHSQAVNSLANNIIPMERVVRRQKRKIIKFAAVAAVALLMVSLGLMSLFGSDVNGSVLTMRSAPGTQFTVTHKPTAEKPEGNILLKGSKLVISQGTVELTFKSGVQSIIQAPATVTLKDDDVLHMQEGSAWFNVPSGAEGFRVYSSDLNVIDLGTEFGVVVKPKDYDEVHCLQGKIKATALRARKESADLLAGESRRTDSIGRLIKIPSHSKLFLSELPTALPHIHFSFDKEDQLIASNTLTGSLNVKVDTRPSSRLSAGVFGSALSLNGREHLMTNWKGILGDAPRTVAFWMKMPETRSREVTTLVAWGAQNDHALNNKFTVHLDHSLECYPMLNISFGGFWYYSPGTVLDDNRWHHLVVVYEGKLDDKGLPITRLYLDGIDTQLERCDREPFTLTNRDPIRVATKDQTPLTLGANLSADRDRLIRDNYFLEGKMDELFIIEGALSEDEILHLKQTNFLE